MRIKAFLGLFASSMVFSPLGIAKRSKGSLQISPDPILSGSTVTISLSGDASSRSWPLVCQNACGYQKYYEVVWESTHLGHVAVPASAYSDLNVSYCVGPGTVPIYCWIQVLTMTGDLPYARASLLPPQP